MITKETELIEEAQRICDAAPLGISRPYLSVPEITSRPVYCEDWSLSDLRTYSAMIARYGKENTRLFLSEVIIMKAVDGDFKTLFSPVDFIWLAGQVPEKAFFQLSTFLVSYIPQKLFDDFTKV